MIGKPATSTGPTTYEEVFSKMKKHINDLTTTVGKVQISSSGTKEQANLFKEFVKKKAEIFTVDKEKILEEVLKHKKTEETEAKSTATEKSLLVAIAAGYKRDTITLYLVLTGQLDNLASLKTTVDEAKTTSGNVRRGHLTSLKDHSSVNSKFPQIESKLITDASPEFAKLFLTIWSHAKEDGDVGDAANKKYESLIQKLEKWEGDFKKKKLEDNESALDVIQNGDDGTKAFLEQPNMNTKHKLDIEKKLREAKNQLRLKQGQLETSLQKIVRQFKLDQDLLDDFSQDPEKGHSQLNEIKKLELDKYLFWRLGFNLSELDLSTEKEATISPLHESLKTSAKEKWDSLQNNTTDN